jgi:hypothetical protein
MKTKIVVTDLTRMQDRRVCVAGYDEDGACIRPVLPPPGIQESSLYDDGCPKVFPFAIVEYDLIKHTPQPPHTEDHLFDPSTVRGCGRLERSKRREFLFQQCFAGVEAIFAQPIHVDAGYYLADGTGTRSLGTILLESSLTVLFDEDANHNLKPRITFVDATGAAYRLAVTDMAWRYYAEYLHTSQRLAASKVAAELQSALQDKEVFLRIGLARGWSQHPDRCYLQVTGIHTFPDYLDGRTFADFAPEPVEDDW